MADPTSRVWALDVLDEVIQKTATEANKAAEAVPWAFDKIGAGTGVGIRLQALKDARSALLDFLLTHSDELIGAPPFRDSDAPKET